MTQTELLTHRQYRKEQIDRDLQRAGFSRFAFYCVRPQPASSRPEYLILQRNKSLDRALCEWRTETWTGKTDYTLRHKTPSVFDVDISSVGPGR